MTAAHKAIIILDAIAESLDDCSPRLAAEIDAVAFAIRKVHACDCGEHRDDNVLDEVAEELESRGAYKLSALIDRVNHQEVNHGS